MINSILYNIYFSELIGYYSTYNYHYRYQEREKETRDCKNVDQHIESGNDSCHWNGLFEV